MRKNRKALYLHSSCTGGRLLKAPDFDLGGGGTPDGSDQGGSQGQQSNNGGVNGDSNGGGGDTNAGQPFDFGAFWQSTNTDNNGGDSGPNAEDAGKELGTQLVSQIKGFKAADVFTPASLEKMAAGDLTELNNGINTAFQAGLTQMLGMTATLLQNFESHFEGRLTQVMQQKIGDSQMSQNDAKLLSDNFKAFANPAAKPMIQGVWNKALEHSKGDRNKALELTRGMLETFGKVGKDDLGFGHFSNPDDNLDEGPSRLVQDLLELRR